jgi:hypothetical protein
MEHDEHTLSQGIPHEMIQDLRSFFRDRSWTAFIIPSGQNEEIDKFLCSPSFLGNLVLIPSNTSGLILQLDEAPQDPFSLTDVFPAFRIALNEATQWPGVLIWTRTGDTVFIPLPTDNIEVTREAIRDIFLELGRRPYLDLEYFILRQQRMVRLRKSPKSLFHIIHLSDIHLGSKEASQRISRVQQLVRNIIGQLETESKIVPLITGDLMDTPSKRCRDDVRLFMDFLSNLGTESPRMILGNHDVRKSGWLRNSYKTAFSLPSIASGVVWYDEHKVGLVCFNSVIKGRLARGYIGPEQLLDMGNEIDRKKDWEEYALIGALHHPIPVNIPEWYSEPFYERVLGNWYEQTDALEDADSFVDFAEKRKMVALLHGHKHIPRITKTPIAGIPVFGCGSTVSKLSTQDGGLYMSINIITLNKATGQLSGRLLAERIPGGGLTDYKHHEVIHRANILRVAS